MKARNATVPDGAPPWGRTLSRRRHVFLIGEERILGDVALGGAPAGVDERWEDVDACSWSTAIAAPLGRETIDVTSRGGELARRVQGCRLQRGSPVGARAVAVGALALGAVLTAATLFNGGDSNVKRRSPGTAEVPRQTPASPLDRRRAGQAAHRPAPAAGRHREQSAWGVRLGSGRATGPPRVPRTPTPTPSDPGDGESGGALSVASPSAEPVAAAPPEAGSTSEATPGRLTPVEAPPAAATQGGDFAFGTPTGSSGG